MKLLVFSVLDLKAAAYLPPFFVRNAGEALRAFGDAANDQGHQFGRHPEDYVLYQVGVWDDSKGELVPQAIHDNFGKAAELVRHRPLPLFPSDEEERMRRAREQFEREAG